MVTLCRTFPIQKQVLYRWLLAIAAAKVMWFVLFIVLRSNAWTEHATVGHIALQPNESFGYYRPMESFIHDGHYQGMCHLPGLMPFYVPLRLFMPETMAMQAMVMLQVIFDIFATWTLGMLAARIFQSIRAMHLTYLLACISTFTAVRNNYLLSDSLCISITILSLFSFSSFAIDRNYRHLLLTGVGLCIAMLLRPAMLVVVPGVAILIPLVHGLSFRSLRFALVIVLPTILALSAWTLRNKLTYGRTVVLLAPLGECQPQITPDFAAIREWILASGGDYQPWAVGGESHWFFDSPKELPMPFEADDFTPGCDSVILLSLKKDYHQLHSGILSESDSLALEQSIIERGQRIRASYTTAHPFRYHVLNKIKFARMILFPTRIDDLPFPALQEMNFVQKIIKAGSLIALPLLSTLSLIALAVWTIRRKWEYAVWMCLPMGLVLVHSYIGFVEQRYLATSYPFFLMLCAGFIAAGIDQFKATRQKHAESLA
jgi:hypothetical protein